MILAKCAINDDLSVELLEYPEITIPEQGLKKFNLLDFFMLHDKQELQSRYATGCRHLKLTNYNIF